MNNIESILKYLIDNLDIGIHIVDGSGATIYYNEAMAQVEGIKKEDAIGKKVVDYLSDVKEDNSTLMNALKNGNKITDVIQHYSSIKKKKITSINTTIPVINENKIIAAIEIAKDMTQLKELTEKICKLQVNDSTLKKTYTFNDIYGKNPIMLKAVEKAKKASLANSSVLIYAETGCGKEVFAQSIHYSGIRKNKPFIPINCAAIPDALLESMLFGTRRGSFTGAENKKGLFEEADGGTILLDEINSMNPYLQSKLLRVLQDGYIRPVGSNKTIDVDVRIIATLNEEPDKLIESGRLRKDLYYRLSVIRINIPPLRDRKEDIIYYVEHYIEYYNKMLGKNIKGIEPEVLQRFYDYNWPGNIRELKNIIESAVNMCDSNIYLSKEYFDIRINKNKGNDILKSGINTQAEMFNTYNSSLYEYINEIEKKIIINMLEQNGNNITVTAKKLGLSRQNLQHKIKKYCIY
ncbi:sigma 54-interacting transcriptional regulator [Clostridium sp. JN-9]|uniref:sigma-54 interaction domain-containing protein n=1 Tax=Clostridium sp. JN-9 TaxID=2507159 RepID=UPI000FFE0E9C|nr:sigma 54-interacting transcriptional regulator [Clostridium sp. JN-9]QAT40261.1 PAS domain-containing protein [Clostridium sp. JN-9]